MTPSSETPSDRVRESWRKHARLEDYERFPIRFITGVSLDPEEVETAIDKMHQRIWTVEEITTWD